MKIELRHLAPYLPYGLKVYTNGYSDTKIITLNGYDTYENPHRINISSVEKYGGQDLDEVKPILRPMSDLIKEIEGVIPLEEIAKIEAPNIVGAVEKLRKVTAFTRGMSFSSHQIGVYYKYENVQVEITLFKDAVFHKKVVDGNDSWIFGYFHNYPAILELLYSYHFDVFGLIDAGLAIDINTIQS